MIFPSLKDPKQALRLKRSLLALRGLAVHTILCLLLLYGNFFRTTPAEFAYLFGFFWVMGLIAPLLIATSLNLRFKDPSLTLYQLIWATLRVMISVFFVYQLRLVLLMYYLMVLVFGAFRLRLLQFLAISLLAIASYGAVIFLLVQTQAEALNLRLEYIQWASFSLVVISFSMLGADLSRLRQTAREQNRQLAKALNRIEKLATTDELTGVWNRRQMMGILERQKALVDRGGYSFVVCYLDLDHFKQINDRYGHQVGDLVLQAVARAARGVLREIDYFARFGGEEFLAVLVNTTLPAALSAAERIRRAVEDIDLPGTARGLKVSVSVGITDSKTSEPVDRVLHRADEALYQAKRSGRNRTVAKFSPNQQAIDNAPA